MGTINGKHCQAEIDLESAMDLPLKRCGCFGDSIMRVLHNVGILSTHQNLKQQRPINAG